MTADADTSVLTPEVPLCSVHCRPHPAGRLSAAKESMNGHAKIVMTLGANGMDGEGDGDFKLA